MTETVAADYANEEAQLLAALAAIRDRSLALRMDAPWEVLQSLAEIERELGKLEPQFFTCLALLRAHAHIVSPIEAMTDMVGALTPQGFATLAQAQRRADELSRAWASADTAIDRVRSRAYAMLGLLLGGVSLVLGIVSIFISLT